jgi:hypothetical protein
LIVWPTVGVIQPLFEQALTSVHLVWARRTCRLPVSGSQYKERLKRVDMSLDLACQSAQLCSTPSFFFFLFLRRYLVHTNGAVSINKSLSGLQRPALPYKAGLHCRTFAMWFSGWLGQQNIGERNYNTLQYIMLKKHHIARSGYYGLISKFGSTGCLNT